MNRIQLLFKLLQYYVEIEEKENLIVSKYQTFSDYSSVSFHQNKGQNTHVT